ncbi:serine-rich adhesin for platelets-like isoform X1 [Ranitomeya imitator]|uniref:serine-rich adhesin for platelets-like isoform X1 n=1 Tax=Ranitomeya imitator TaxID=111125 RepID=UPI001AAA07FE
MLAIMSWIVLLIYAASCAFADTCLVEISIESKIIKEMIDTQGYFCSMPVKILSKEKVTENCDLWALVYEVDGLLEKLNFTPGTRNYENKNKLIDSFKDCLAGEQHSVLDAVKSYLQTVNLNPIEILQRVNDSLHKLNRFHASSSSVSECESYYKKHGQNNNDATKGPRCACPSPTTPIFSSATSQPSPSYLSEVASRTYTSSHSLHASPLAEDMSVSYPDKLINPQKNSHGFDSSPFISTDLPNDLKSLTTIVDYSHSGSTGRSGDHTDIPLTRTEFTKDIYEPSFVSLHPYQTSTDPEKVNKDVSNSDTEGMHESEVPPTTLENQSLPSHLLLNGEISTVMDPDETMKTTTLDSQSSMGSVFQHSLSVPSKEPGIEMSYSSVTKKRRSILYMGAISRADLTTQADSSLSISTNDPNHPFLSSVQTIIPSSRMSLSNTEAPESMSQGKVIKDNGLGWASSYLSSTVQTSKSEPSMSSSVPGSQVLLPDVTHNPVLNVLKSHNILPHQEINMASDDKQNSVSGPNHSSNMLPFIATEQFEDGRKKEHDQSKLPLIIIVILVMLVLLFLCGFLYYKHQYQALQRRLNISYDLDLDRNPGTVMPEERVHLQIIECENV